MIYKKVSGTDFSGMTANATYYAMPYTSTAFRIATTKANAISGSYITIGGTTTTNQGGGSYYVTPLALTGQAAFKWQASNNNVNYVDLSVSSITVTNATAGETSTLWDFAKANYRYMRVNYVAPLWGAIKVKLIGYGEKVAP
jgi:hypothetical protein